MAEKDKDSLTINQLEKKVGSLQADNESLQTSLDSSKSQYDSLKSKYDSSKKKVSKLQTELKGKEEDCLARIKENDEMHMEGNLHMYSQAWNEVMKKLQEKKPRLITEGITSDFPIADSPAAATEKTAAEGTLEGDGVKEGDAGKELEVDIVGVEDDATS